MLDTGREMAILRAISKEELAGIVVCPFFEDTGNPEYIALINAIARSGRKVVALDQYVPGADVPVAMADKFAVGYIAVEHLLMLGHRRICYISSDDTAGHASRQGYRQALNDYGVMFEGDLMITLPIKQSAEPSYHAIRERLTANPRYCTGLVSPNLSMTYGAWRALRELGIKVGEDIALMGGDLYENPELAELPHTRQEYDEVAYAGVQLLLADEGAENHCRHVLVPPKLVVGGEVVRG